MIIIKNFSIFKKKKTESDKAPTHSMSSKVGDEFMEIGSAWTKETSSGDKYLSAQLSKAYSKSDGTAVRKSLVIVAEEELKELFEKAGIDYPLE